MLNPFGSNNDTGSYFNLQKRILQRVQSSGINEQIIESVRRAYEDAINAENIVLSGPERRRLFSQISKFILEDVNKKLDEGSTSV